MDTLKDAKLLYAENDAGDVIGRKPEPDKTFSAEFLVACASYGRKK